MKVVERITIPIPDPDEYQVVLLCTLCAQVERYKFRCCDCEHVCKKCCKGAGIRSVNGRYLCLFCQIPKE